MKPLAGLIPVRYHRAARRAYSLPHRRDLDRLARIYGTDKSSRDHGYTDLYIRHLPGRQDVSRLLEVGIGGTTSTWGYETLAGGASLLMWQDYFPKAQIVGLDIHPKSVSGPRITVERGSQADAGFLSELADRHGGFDVIIDDGSHVGWHQITTLHALFNTLRSGGVYVIEDLATAYSEEHGGGPKGSPRTSATLLQDAVHDVLRAHWELPGQGIALPVKELHLYDEIAFLVHA